MGQATKIEWCDHTASPWHGCTKVAAGCANCYAERQSRRNPVTLGVWGDDGVRVKSKSFIKNLRTWNKQGEAQGKPVRVFPSICDPFEDRPELVPWREEMFAVADTCPWVILLLLTKRPENILRMRPSIHEVGTPRILGMQHRNVWLGTSVATQYDADRNIPLLLQCRDLSPVLFVSAEPLLEEIDLIQPLGHAFLKAHGLAYSGKFVGMSGPCDLDWLIIGGESGPNARPCRPEWIRSLVRQCRDAGVPTFVKQMGTNVITRNDMIEDAFNDGESGWPDPDVEYNIHGFREDYQGADCRIRLRDPKGGDWSEWPEALRVRELPVA